MNQEIKAKWVEALRSGKYKQGIGKLRSDENYFCCLGVLCDIRLNEFKDGIFSNDGEFPDQFIVDWAGLDISNPILEYKGGENNIADLNDDVGLAFTEIADLIEAQL